MIALPAVASQRSRQREATRRQLLEAGLRMVATEGFAGTSTAAIAQATGKAHGTVFLHFRTRDALVAEIGRSMSDRLAALETATPTLREVIDAHLTALAEHEVLYARVLAEASTLPPAARARLFALQSAIASRLRAAHARARTAGEVRALDAVVAANLWIALTNHYLMNRDLFAPGESVVVKCGADLAAQWLALVST